MDVGGEGGIRTHGTVSRSGAFKAPALVHYATSPGTDSYACERGEHPDPSRPVGVGYGTLCARESDSCPRTWAPGGAGAPRGRHPQPRAERDIDQGRRRGCQPGRPAAAAGPLPAAFGASVAIIGLEVSGTIAAVGADVTNWAIENTCVALLAGGGYAEYARRACRAGRTAAARGRPRRRQRPLSRSRRLSVPTSK